MMYTIHSNVDRTVLYYLKSKLQKYLYKTSNAVTYCEYAITSSTYDDYYFVQNKINVGNV